MKISFKSLKYAYILSCGELYPGATETHFPMTSLDHVHKNQIWLFEYYMQYWYAYLL